MITQIDIPNNVLENYNEISKIDNRAILALLCYKDYADGNKSLGNIANDLNMSKRTLYDIYESARMPIATYSVNDLNNDIKTLEELL